MPPPTAFTVIIPALDEEPAVAGVVREAFAGGAAEVIVVDSGSTDATAAVASAAGAVVVHAVELDPGAPVLGKGDALWRAVPLAAHEVVVFLDGDLTIDGPAFLAPLVAPVVDGTAVFAKADFRRLAPDGGPPRPGRVTATVARPLIERWFPELADLDEPLSGQVAARREVLASLPFEVDYGLEIGMLIDVCERYGRGAIAHPDCGVLAHLPQADASLDAMAAQVARAVARRTGGADADPQPRPPRRAG